MQKIIVTFGLLLIAAFVAAFLCLNFLVKKAVNTDGPKIMKVDVQLAAANISPLSGSGSLIHLLIGNPKGYKTPYALLLGGIQIQSERDTLFSNPIIIKKIAIEKPEITIEGTPFGNNLTTLLANLKSSSKSAKEEKTSAPAFGAAKKSKKVIVKEIVITGAKLHVHVSAADQSLDQKLPLPDIVLRNIGSDGSGVSANELAQQILTPLLVSAIKEGGTALAKQGIKQMEKQGAGELNKVLGSFLK
jgi:hypothetical protein